MGHVLLHMKSLIKLLLATAAGMLPMKVVAQDSAVAEPENEIAENKVAKTDYVRVTEDKQSVQLQTSVTRYVKDGVSVDLIGAVHIADKQYFMDLNTLFTKSEVLLFEMVGGDKMVRGKLPEGEGAKKKDTQFNFLGVMYNTMQKRLALAGQKDHIDYSKENFVHADLSMEEFRRLQKEKKESILSFALKSGQGAAAPKKQPAMGKLLLGLLTGNADMLKLNIVHTLGQGDDQIAEFTGKSVIIGDRNVKCLEVMNDQIAMGKKNIGIFYGAAHFPDMEERMIKMGFQKTNQYWMTAWDINKKRE